MFKPLPKESPHGYNCVRVWSLLWLTITLRETRFHSHDPLGSREAKEDDDEEMRWGKFWCSRHWPNKIKLVLTLIRIGGRRAKTHSLFRSLSMMHVSLASFFDSFPFFRQEMEGDLSAIAKFYLSGEEMRT